MNTKKYQQREPLIQVFINKNNQINLSAIRDKKDIYTKHILDALELENIFDLNTFFEKKDIKTPTLLDLGTGGGFPLLPLAITYTNINCFGLDARRKKINAINDMIKKLNIPNAQAFWGRAEAHTKQYNIITARSVSYADKIFQRSFPLIKKGGILILYKLFTYIEDNAILRLIRQKNMTLLEMHHYTLPNDETKRIIYIIEK